MNYLSVTAVWSVFWNFCLLWTSRTLNRWDFFSLLFSPFTCNFVFRLGALGLNNSFVKLSVEDFHLTLYVNQYQDQICSCLYVIPIFLFISVCCCPYFAQYGSLLSTLHLIHIYFPPILYRFQISTIWLICEKLTSILVICHNWQYICIFSVCLGRITELMLKGYKKCLRCWKPVIFVFCPGYLSSLTASLYLTLLLKLIDS